MSVANPVALATVPDTRRAALSWSFALAPPSALVAAAAAQPFIDPRLLFIDPIAAAEQTDSCCGAALGLMSNLGAVVIAAGFGIALAAAAASDAPARVRTAMACAAMLSAAICLDDLLLLHERVLPGIGIPELPVELVYGASGVGLVLAHRAWMPPRAFAMLVLAMALLGLSVGLDMALEIAAFSVPTDLQARLVAPAGATAVTVIEDGAKFVGYWLWTCAHCAAMQSGLRGAQLGESAAVGDASCQQR